MSESDPSRELSHVPAPAAEWAQGAEWEEDVLAKFEDQKQPIEQLIKDQISNNKLQVHKAVGDITSKTMYLAWSLLVAAIGILAWHYFVPDRTDRGFVHGWLTKEQIQHLQSVIFSGALGAVITGAVRYHLGSERQDAKG